MRVAIIPARGGSKRISNKNIRHFRGKPIISYSIETALASKLFDKIIISTDDDQIANIAESCGAEVPFRRPTELANDMAPTIPVVKHALEWLEQTGFSVELVCCIYATAPFMKTEDLNTGLKIMESNPQAEFAIPVTTFSFPIFRSVKMKEGFLKMFYPEHTSTRSQDLPTAWHDAGQFYWGRNKAWKSRSGFFNSHSMGIPIPRHRVHDIDDNEDWIRAELIHSALEHKKNANSR